MVALVAHGSAGARLPLRQTLISQTAQILRENISDGEWQEGSCWEALNFAIHQRLENLTILVDQNGMQGFGSTAEVISCADLTPRFAAFGAHVQHIDGHDPCGSPDRALPADQCPGGIDRPRKFAVMPRQI